MMLVPTIKIKMWKMKTTLMLKCRIHPKQIKRIRMENNFIQQMQKNWKIIMICLFKM